MRDAIEALRPRYVLIENVKGLLSAKAIRDVESQDDALGVDDPRRVLRAIGAVLGDLSDIGYDAEWTSVRASDVGAAHRRERVFILAFPADAASLGRERLDDSAIGAAARPGRERVTAGSVGRTTGVVGALLPTPSVADGTGGHVSRSGDRVDELLLGGIARAYTEGALLPTPTARLGNSRGASDPDRRHALQPKRSGELDEIAVHRLMPTPRASDGSKGSPNQRGSGGDLMLPSAVYQLLPTPRTTDSHGTGQHGRGGADLRTSIGSLLPTPQASDGSGGKAARTVGGTRPSGAKRAVGLSDAARHLLPTPSAADSTGGGQHPDHREGHSQQLIDYALLAGSQRWGDYEPAIRRQERLSRAAPSPTEPNTQGRPRLSAAFAQWLMFWPENWVTDPALGLSRVSQLKIIGNGVCPPQAVAAFTHLLTREFDYAHP